MPRDGAIIFGDRWPPVRYVRRVVQGGTPANRGTDTMGRPGAGMLTRIRQALGGCRG
jgi:hypothetical protein